MNKITKGKSIGMILLAALMACVLLVSAATALASTPASPTEPAADGRLDKPLEDWERLLPYHDREWVSPCGFITLERVEHDVVRIKGKVVGDCMFVLVLTEGDGIIAVPVEEFDAELHDAVLAESMDEVALLRILGVDNTVGPNVKIHSIYTITVTYRRTFRSLVGLRVAQHDASTTWTCWPAQNFMFSGPRSLDSDWWTLPPTFMDSYSEDWDWFFTGHGGTGRANHHMTFVFGVPTPWGPIGSTFSSRIRTTVRADGTHDTF